MDKIIDFFKVLSDETRLRIMILLYHKELCVCEICDIMQESQPKISRHLAKLRDIGLVKDERQNQWIFYYLNLEDALVKKVFREIVDSLVQQEQVQFDMRRLNEKQKNNNLCERKQNEREGINHE